MSHGPGPRTETNPLGWEPDWRMPIRVVDNYVLGIKRFRRKRRAIWRRARAEALAMWEQAGLTFDVREERADVTSPLFPTYDGTTHFTWYCLPGVLRLIRVDREIEDSLPYAVDKGGWGWWSEKWSPNPGPDGSPVRVPGGGAAFFRLIPNFWKSDGYKPLRAHIAHEIGHALGMWHKQGGLMGGGFKPDEHELDALRTYYLGG